MTIEDFLSRLEGVSGGNGQYKAKCPAHDDKKASLSVGKGRDNKIVMKCHAGCNTVDVLEAMGLTESDLFDNSQKPTQERPNVVARYNYTDAQGRILNQKTRFSDKSFSWSHYESGKWWRGRKGDPVLYNLSAVTGTKCLYIVEGEKDVETLKIAGIPAVCGADGAGPGKWLPQYTEALRGKQVAVIQDNDKIGKAFAAETANALHGAAASVRVLDLTRIWSELPEHGDTTDIVEHFGKEGFDKIQQLAKDAPEWVPMEVKPISEKKTVEPLKTISAQELQQKEIPPARFVVVDMLPQGLSMLASPPKYGKSWFVLDLCLSVASGDVFLNHRTNKSGCLYLALEDSERRLKDRMSKLLMSRRAPDGFNYATSANDISNGLIEQLQDYLNEHQDTSLIVIDTLQKVRSSGGRENAYSADYKDMTPLQNLAIQKGICILLVHHLRKMADDGDVFNRISGTNGLFGAVHTAMPLSKAKRSDTQTTLSITGRDVDTTDTVLEFNKDTYKWRVLGDLEDRMEQKRRDEYERNPIVQTIRILLQRSPLGWTGTAAELFQECIEKAGTYPAADETRLSKLLKPLAPLLFEWDGIVYKPPTYAGRGGRKHTFTHKPTATWTYDPAEDVEILEDISGDSVG